MPDDEDKVTINTVILAQGVSPTEWIGRGIERLEIPTPLPSASGQAPNYVLDYYQSALEVETRSVVIAALAAGVPVPKGIAAEPSLATMKVAFDMIMVKLKDIEELGFPHPTTIYDLDESHPLRMPVQILLQESEDVFVASWPELHLYADGETANDAMAALKREIVSLYDDLTSTPSSQLGVLPKRWLTTLAQVIQ